MVFSHSSSALIHIGAIGTTSGMSSARARAGKQEHDK
jgi:hypothetical protein